MYISNPKKMNILLILEVLKKHSDENNKLSQKEVADILESEYDVPVERHTIKRNLDSLLEFHCGVEYKERDKESGEPGGWYFEREITDAEIRMLIDGLLFSKYIPYSECKSLVGKLEKIAGIDFRSSHGMPENRPENKQIFLCIEDILKAISSWKKITFNYMRYKADKNPHITLNNDGNPREYIVSPIEIVITNGHYYMICIPEHTDELYHFRLKNMCNVKILKSEKRRFIRDIPGYRNGFRLADYMKERPYMLASGKSVRVFFRVRTHFIEHILDWFGNDVNFMEDEEGTEDTKIATITVNDKAMLFWALQYGQVIEVLEPVYLREQIRDAVNAMAQKYNS